MELAERMRQQNHEQFQTLVRMHLSFELDLHTDDNDVAPIGDGKGAKFRKRFHFNKKPKTAPPAKAGSPVLSKECVGQMRKLMEFLMKDQNVIQEGIFRRTGSVARQNELKTRVINDSATAPPLRLDSGTYTVHDCASVLKGVLADLPEPLLTETYAPAHLQMAELCHSLETSTTASASAAATSSTEAEASSTKATRLLHSLQLLILLLPTENRLLLQEIIEMLNVTIRHECSNKMSADSLATLFTPHLICPKKLTPEALHSTAANLSGIISFMITRGAAIFECPPKLATDIRAYFAEQRRKQTLSPEQILDESVTSDSTANTVYTFVDRERTAQAHDQNPTDTCLAQLYAYIQSLPESSKKRKLIKQFNKENGQGTPLQVQKLHRLKNGGEGGSASKTGQGKSLSDSIKRHIFQKNLLARTPKIVVNSDGGSQQFATPGPLVRAFDTPTNRSTTSQPLTPQPLKSRVLFQSPATTPCRPLRPVPVASISSGAPKTTTITISTLAVAPQITSKAKARSPSNISAATDDSCDALESSEFELLSETISQLQTAASSYTTSSSSTDGSQVMTAKKSVAFSRASSDKAAAADIDDIHELHDDCENNLSVSLQSRHRSEPNLTNILGEHNVKRSLPVPAEPGAAASVSKSLCRQTGGRFISNKLLKGVSMVNLMVPTSESNGSSGHKTPHLRKSTSSQLLRSTERHPSVCPRGVPSRSAAQLESDADEEEEDIDDPDFVATPQSQRSRSSTYSRRFSADGDFADIVTPTTRAGGGHAASLLMQQQHVLNLGRRSMSPITKSTQRMSKAMQESIMTPRSRKPVMLPGALLGLADAVSHGGGAQNSFCSFREQDEDEHFGTLDTMPVDHGGGERSLGTLYKSKSEGDFGLLQATGNPLNEVGPNVPPSSGVRLSLGSATKAAAVHDDDMGPESLTSPFKNYLFSRSVVSASPVDSSFSSQPDDDFGSTPDDIHTLATTETDLSDSLLYCLDGNQPQTASSEAHCASTSRSASSASTLSRKRTNGGAEDGNDAAEQRRYFDDLPRAKKVTVTLDGPGETSL